MIYYLLGAVFVLAFIGVDVRLAVDHIPRNTWSEMGRHVARLTPVLPWAVGVLAGHVFHPDIAPLRGQPHVVPLLCFTGAVFALGIVARANGHPLPGWALLAPGFVAGWLLWPSGG